MVDATPCPAVDVPTEEVDAALEVAFKELATEVVLAPAAPVVDARMVPAVEVVPADMVVPNVDVVAVVVRASVLPENEVAEIEV